MLGHRFIQGFIDLVARTVSVDTKPSLAAQQSSRNTLACKACGSDRSISHQCALYNSDRYICQHKSDINHAKISSKLDCWSQPNQRVPVLLSTADLEYLSRPTTAFTP